MSLFSLMATLGLDSSAYESGLEDAEGKATSFGSKLKSGLTTAAKLGAGAVTAAGAAITAFGVTSVKAGATFDSSMSQVAATMGYTVEELNDVNSEAYSTMQTLREFAQEMGSTTAFSASEAADALNYMALAGYDAETSMAMLPNVLNLAAAGGIDLAYASDMVTDAQSALGLSIEETESMVDQMAMAASKSNTSVSQLGEAMLTIGANARNVKGGTTELATILGVLADNGIKGAEGGTHLRNIMLSLQNPTEDAAAALDSLGIAVYDSDGNMRSMIDIIGDMQTSLGDMDQASQDAILSGIFNKTDLAAVGALINTDAERFDELTAAINDSAGAAQAMAEVQLDNLSGDITLFKSALEGLKIAVSDQITPALREFVQFGSDALSDLTTAFKEGGIDGAMDAVGTILSKALTMIVAKIPEVVKLAVKLIKAFTNGIVDNLPTLIDAVVEIISVLAEALTENPQGFVDVAVSIITALANGLSKAVPILISTAAVLLTGLLKGLTNPTNIQQLAESAVGLVRSIADGILDAIPLLIEAVPEIIDNLISALTESLPIILTAGGEILGALLDGIHDNLPGIIDAALGVITSFSQFITQNLPNILQMGVELLSNFISGIMADLPVFVEAVVSIIGSFLTVITEALPDIVEAGLGILSSLVSGIVDNLPKLIEAIGDLVSTILVQVAESLPSILESGAEILTTIIEGIISVLPTLVETVVEVVTSFISTITENLPNILEAGTAVLSSLIEGIISALPTIADAVLQIVSSLVTSITENLPTILQAGIDMLTSLISGIIESLPTVAETALSIVTGLVSTITENLPTIIDSGVTMLTSLIQGIVDSLPDLISTVVNLVADFILTIIESLPDIVESGVSMIGSLIQGIADSLPDFIASVVEVVSTLLTTITERLPDILAAGVSMVTELITGMVETLPDVISAIVDLVTNIITTITENLPDIVAMGVELVGSLILGLLDAIPTLIEAIPSLISSIVDTFAETDWLSVGTNIVQGIIDGIVGMGEALWNSLKNVANSALNKVKGWFGIQSPSKVMRDQVGKMLGLGLAEGIEDSTANVVSEAQNMAEEVLQEMRPLESLPDVEMGVKVAKTGEYGAEGNSGVVINVYGTEGQDVEELAQLVGDKIAYETQREGYAWA